MQTSSDAFTSPGWQPAYNSFLLSLRQHIRGCALIMTIALIAALLAYALMTPQYRADAIVSLENARLQSMPNQLAVSPAAVDLFAVKAAAETFSSPEVIDHTLDTLNLWHDPELTQITLLNRVRSGLVDFASRELQRISALKDWTSAASLTAPSDYRDNVRERFRRHILVSQTPQSLLLSIGYMSSDPRKAMLIANTLAAAYLDVGRELKIKQIDFAMGQLEITSDRFHDRMIAAQDKLKAYKDKLGIVELGNATQMTASTQHTVELEGRYVAARAERVEREKTLEQLRRRVESYVPGAGIGGFASASVQQLELQRLALIQRRAEIAASYGPTYPMAQRISKFIDDTDRSIHSALDTFVGSTADALRVAQSKEDALASELKAANAQSQQQSQANSALVDLEAQAAAAKSLFETSRINLGRATESISLQLPDARVISKATVPLRPSSPQLLLLGALGAVIGGACSALYVYVSEASKRKLAGIVGLEEFPGARVMALLPRLGKTDLHSSIFRSAVNAARLQLTSRAAHGGNKPGTVILVTSSLAEEGKTVLSSTLAEASAQSGVRVLLIEGDIRKPSVYSSLPGQGLTAILDGGTDLSTTPLSERIPGLSVLPSGEAWTRTFNVAEYENFKLLINQATKSFDLIIVDSPPVLTTPDAAIFSKLADRVLFTIRWSTTPLSAAARGLHEVLQTNSVPLAICVTDISPRQIRRLSRNGSYYFRSHTYPLQLSVT